MPKFFALKHLIVVLYLLGGLLIAFLVFTFFYQYIAALGSFDAVFKEFGNIRIITALILSLLSAAVTLVIAIVLGVPLAYIYAMKEFKGKLIVETLTVDVPQTFPPVAEGMIFLLMLGPASPFNVNIAFTFAALVVAKLYVSTPFVISYSARKFREIKQSGINLTARSLGANPFQVFTTILLPLARKDIGAGATLCWSRAMGELGGSIIFAGVIPGKTEIIPTFIATQATTLTAAALAATIMVTTASTLAIITVKRLSVDKGE